MNFLRQSTSVDVAIGPFVDATDGVTAETGLTITQPDVRLKKNGGAWAQKAAAQTLSHEENGWYEVTLDATDTNTVGILVVAVNESGALPVWREFQVVEEAVYDRDYAASATGIIGTSQTGDAFARLGAPVGASISADVAAVKTQTAAIETDTQDIQSRLPAALVNSRMDCTIDGTGMEAGAVTAVQSGLATAANLATVAGYLDTEIAAILADTNELQTDWADGGRLDLILDARASQASVDTIDDLLDTEIGALTTAVADLPTNAELATALGTADDAVLAAVATVDTVVDAIKAKTDSLTFTTAGLVDANVQQINDVTITGDGQPGTEFNV